MIRDTYKKLFADETSLRALIEEVVSKGYITLPHFFDDESEKKFLGLREAIGPKNLKGEMLAGTFANEVRLSEDIFTICEQIYKTRCAVEGVAYTPLKREKQSVGIAYKNAQNNAQNKETEFHYDAAYINIVIPVQLPPKDDGGDGDLIAFPNLRKKYPRLVCSVLSEILRRSAWARAKFGFTKVSYTVGTLHLFFGDVSLHGVPPIRHGERMIMTINSHW
ncbi:MAG: hypothetical protein RLZZ234_271 [Candidatus Parcubacteria bacterium]|jgi:hypothetical protein